MPSKIEINIDCARCGTHNVGATVVYLCQTSSDQMDPNQHALGRALVKCRKCGDFTFMDFEHPIPPRSYAAQTDNIDGALWKGITGEIEPVKVYPQPRSTDAPKHTPQLIADTYGQAVRALNAGGWLPASMTFRKVLELSVNDRGGQGRNLYAKIEDLKDRHLIPETLYDWATELRLGGNSAAHDDPLADHSLGNSEANALHGYTRYLLIYLYEMPGEVEERRQSVSPASADGVVGSV